MIRSYFFLVIVVIIYSGNLLVGKAINELPPITISFFRALIAFLIVLPFGFKQFRQNTHIWKSNWKPLLSIGLTGIALFNTLIYLSLNFTTTTNAGIVEATTPVFTIILSYFFLKERLKSRQLIGALISILGAVWVLTNGNLKALFTLNYNIGDIIMIAAVIVWAIYTIIIKLHNHKFPALGGLVVMLGYGLIIFTPLLIIEWAILGIPEGLLNGKLWLGLLYLGIFPSFIALLLWNKSVMEIGASLASIFLNLVPLFTAIGAVLFLNERIVMAQIVGGLLVIFGVLLVNIDFKKMFKTRKKEKKAA